MTVTDALIPVAGLGTRLLPATRAQPKEMLPVVDRPAVQYVVEELVHAGVARILFVTGRRKRSIEDHFDADPELQSSPLFDHRSGLQLLYTRQFRPAGLGDAIRAGAGLTSDHGVVIALGDAIIEPPPHPTPGIVPRLIEVFERTGAVAAVAVEEVDDAAVSRYGIVVGEERAGVIEAERVVEKPRPGTVTSRLAVAARYVLGPSVFETLRDTAPDANGEVQVADALTTLVGRGERVVAVRLAPGEHRHDIGTVQSYCSAFLRYALRDQRFGAEMRAEAEAILREGD